jgi:hypothetical protein
VKRHHHLSAQVVMSKLVKEHKGCHTQHGLVICCRSQGKRVDDGGKEKDHREEEEKYTASKKPTANPTKRKSVSEGV